MYNAGPVDLNWADSSAKVVTILENFYPAQVLDTFILCCRSCIRPHPVQTAGSALADVLTGVASPGGRLPYTWPMSLDQVWTCSYCPQESVCMFLCFVTGSSNN